MDFTRRRKFGLAVIGASIFAAVIIQLLTDQVVQIHTMPGTQPIHVSDNVAVSVVGVIKLEFKWPYAIPLAGCGAVGLICLAWPDRKPPRLVS
jgi:hypothetical protein